MTSNNYGKIGKNYIRLSDRWLCLFPNNGQEEHEVDPIVAHKRQGQKYQYLVKWLGYPTSENTWEPEVNLKHSAEILKAYKLKKHLWPVISSTNMPPYNPFARPVSSLTTTNMTPTVPLLLLPLPNPLTDNSLSDDFSKIHRIRSNFYNAPKTIQNSSDKSKDSSPLENWSTPKRTSSKIASMMD